MAVPYTFGSATSAIPLSQLDSNFATTITLGNTAIQLGNTVTTLNNMTLANVTISSGNVTITNVSVTTANVTTLNAATVIATTGNITTVNATTVVATTANATTANITTGNLTDLNLTNNPTLNGGTANGVLYLNGSKVATSGSALTFDGASNFSYGGSNASTYNTLNVNNTSATGFARILFNVGSSGANGIAAIKYAPGVFMQIGPDANDTTTPLVFAVNNGSEQMRLTSTGLGVGTSSPQRKIHGYITTGPVARMQTNGSNAAIEYVPGATDGSGTIYNWVVGAQYNVGNAFEITPSTAAGGLTFSTPALLVTSVGSVGIGTSSPGYKLDVNGVINTSADLISQGNNARISLYRSTGINYFDWASGQSLYFSTQTSAGGAGRSTLMTLDSSGNLGLGVTPSAWGSGYKAYQNLKSSWFSTSSRDANFGTNVYVDAVGYKYIDTAAASLYTQYQGAHSWYYAASGTAGNAISFTQAMTLDASGNLAIGRTSASATLDIEASGGASTYWRRTGFSNRGTINVDGTNATLASEGALLFGTGSGFAERARIDSSGNLLVGTTSAGAGAILDVQSTTKGVRFPNMTTTQKNAITPAAGTVVFDTTLAKLCVYSGSAWQTITSV